MSSNSQHFPSPSPSSAPSPTQFHPDFDLEVFMVAFSVEGQGFKTDAARLCMHSEVMRSMLYGNDGKRGGLLGLAGEGTAENPIKVEGCTAETFANFMGWLNHVSWETPLINGLAGYLDVLHMTHLWQIRSGFRYAVDAISTKFSLRSAHKIYLACRYGIPEWIPVPVRVLLSLPLKNLTEEDYNHIGYEAFTKLAAGKEDIQDIRRELAFVVPYPKFDEAPHCSSPQKCKKAWFKAWGFHLFRRIHHPSIHLPVSDILITLRSINHIGMHVECKNYVINWVEDTCPGLQKEERAIRQVVASIQEQARIHMMFD